MKDGVGENHEEVKAKSKTNQTDVDDDNRDEDSSSSSSDNLMYQVLIAIFFSFVLPLSFVMLLANFGGANIVSGTTPNIMEDANVAVQNNPSITTATPSSSSGSYGAHYPVRQQQQVINNAANGMGKIHNADNDIHDSVVAGLERPPDDDNVYISEQQIQYAIEAQQLSEQLKHSPNDMILWVKLGNAQIYRDLSSMTRGAFKLDFVQSYQHALRLIGIRSAFLSINDPNSEELAQASENRCKILNVLVEGCEAAYLTDNVIRFASQIIDHSHCSKEETYKALMTRARTYVSGAKFSNAYNDVDFILKDNTYLTVLLKGNTNDPYSLMTSILEGDENVSPNGWQWLVNQAEDAIAKLTSVLETNPSDTFAPNMLTSIFQRALGNAHRSLFTYYDKKTDDVSKAWYHLHTANELKKKYTSFPDVKGRDDQIDERTKFYTEDFFEEMLNSGIDSNVPIFIVGFPRSGTTLLECIFDSHPSIAGLGEASALLNMIPRLHKEIPDIYSMYGENSLRQNLMASSTQILRTMWGQFENLYQHDNAIKSQKIKFLVDKQNVNYQFIPFIHLLYPNAIIINLVREPMDTVFSNYRLDLSSIIAGREATDSTCDFEQLAIYYKTFRRVIRAWDKVLPGRITHIRYDDLVNDTENVARALLTMLELDWDPEVLNFHEKKRSVHTASNNQVRNAIYKHSIQRWRKYEKELLPLRNFLGDDAVWDQKTTLPFYNTYT